MTTCACLRVVIAVDDGADELLTGCPAHVEQALQDPWPAPRRSGEIAPKAFLLADPESATLADVGTVSGVPGKLYAVTCREVRQASTLTAAA